MKKKLFVIKKNAFPDLCKAFDAQIKELLTFNFL